MHSIQVDIQHIIDNQLAKLTEANYLNESHVNSVLEETKYFIDQYFLDEAQTNAKTILDALVEQETTQEVLDIINDAKDLIDNAMTPAEVQAILDQALADVALQEAKEAAIAELVVLKDNATQEVIDIIDEAIADILDAETIAEVDTLKAQSIVDVEVQEAKEYLEEQLTEYIKDVLAPKENLEDIISDYIDNINESNYGDVLDMVIDGEAALLAEERTVAKAELDLLYGDASPAVQAIIDNAKDLIDNTDIKDIKGILEQALIDIAVKEAKEEAIAELEVLENGATQEVLDIITQAIIDIEAANSVYDIKDILDEALVDIALQRAKEDAISELVALKGDASQEVINIIDQAIADINGADTLQEVADLLDEALVDVGVQEAKEFVEDILNDYIKDVEAPTNYLEDIINTTLTNINENNYDNVVDITNIITNAKDALLTKEQTEAKDELDTLYDDGSQAVKNIIDEAKGNIDNANIEDIKAILDQALEDIELQEEKEGATTELVALKDGASQEVIDIINQAIADIENADTVQDVEDILDQAKADILSQEDFEQNLQDAKDDAIAELNNLKDEASQEVIDIIDEAIANILDAETIVEVDTLKTEAIVDVEVQEAKEDAISELEDLKGGASQEVIDIIDQAIADIEDADTTQGVGDILNKALADVALQGAKEDAIAELVALKDDASQEVIDIIDEVIANILDAETIAEVNTLKTEAIVDVEVQEAKELLETELTDYIKDVDEPTDYLEDIIDDFINSIDENNYEDILDIIEDAKEELLDAEKDKAKDELDALYDDASDTVKDIIDEAKGNIDNANIDEIKDLLENTLEDIELQKEKEDAIAELEDLKGGASQEVIDIIDQAIADINGADTLQEVADLLEEAIIDIDVQEAKELLETELTDYIKDVEEPTDYLKDIIDDFINGIDENNYEDILDIIEDAKEELLDAEKDKAKDLLDDLYDDASNAVKDIIDEAKDNIDNSGIDEIKDLLEDALDDIELQEAKEDAIAELEDLKDGASQGVLDIIDQAIGDIEDENTTQDVEDMLNQAKDDVELQETKEDAIAELEDLKDGASQEVLDIIDQAIANIEDEETTQDVENILDQAKDDVELQETKEDVRKELENLVDETYSQDIKDIINGAIDGIGDSVTVEEALTKLEQAKQDVLDELFKDLQDQYKQNTIDDKHLFDNEGISDNNTLYNEIEDLYHSNNVTPEQIKDAIGTLKDMKVRYSDNNIRPGVGDDITVADDEAYGFGRAKNGFNKGDKIIIDIESEVVNEEEIRLLIEDMKLVHKFGDLTNEELRDLLIDQVIYSQLDIYIVDKDGNKVNNPAIDEYTIYMLLPEELRNKENIRVIFFDTDTVEVFDIEIVDDWISFTTDHLSPFYIIGDSDIQINIWWIIIMEVIVMFIVLLMIVSKRKENRKMKALKANSLTLPILASLVPGGALAIIIIFAAIIILELGYLIYLFLSARRQLQPVEQRPKPVVETETVVVVAEPKPEPVVIPEVEPEPVVVPVIPAEETRTIYNYSFKSRLHLATADTADRYNEIKNFLLSYEGVTANMSWKQETFILKGKMVVKLRLQGKTMRVYIGVNPADYADTKYNIQDVSNTKIHESTPSLLVVRGPGILKHAIELIEDLMNSLEAERDENYVDESYRERNLGRDRLVEKGLIKVQEAKFIKK